jgi:hypothetical protein
MPCLDYIIDVAKLLKGINLSYLFLCRIPCGEVQAQKIA